MLLQRIIKLLVPSLLSGFCSGYAWLDHIATNNKIIWSLGPWAVFTRTPWITLSEKELPSEQFF